MTMLPDGVLIANRGEIACRIIRTCKRLGVRAVAVYSDADSEALHVRKADEAIRIGPSPARHSYLDADAVLRAAKQAAVSAIHPGYGFLAENADFAARCIDAGLAYVGPDPDTIKRMGNKNQARSIAAEAGLPLLPGSEPLSDADEQRSRRAARAIGYPLIAKAVAGGGGLGMRVVSSDNELEEALRAGQGIAASAFGDATMYLERLLPRARHIEVQVFGLGDGRAVHLYERDCSTQRRYQKVVEYTPALHVDAATLSSLHRSAVALTSALRYRGAGTVEYLVGDDGDFYFLEMNTRIQVEHPVTEARTGVDLVEWQMRLAGGDTDSFPNQAGVVPTGAAIECRVYAEDPARGFLPSPGTLTTFHPPTGQGIRVDSGVEEGSVVTPYYDALLCKLVVDASDFERARSTTIDALAAFEIGGVMTNVPLLRAFLRSRLFRTGSVTTDQFMVWSEHHGGLARKA
jgi:3-methylcrotonyl-CoA carboxylase alpha subunit